MARLERLTAHNVEALHVLCTGARTEFARAKEAREAWLREMFEKALTGWVAYEAKTPVGYIEYMPLEHAPYNVTGKEGHFITCLWVLQEHRGQGAGSALLQACLADCPDGVSTLAYRGIEYKPAEFFERSGFESVHQEGNSVLLTRGNLQVRRGPRGRYAPRELEEQFAAYAKRRTATRPPAVDTTSLKESVCAIKDERGAECTPKGEKVQLVDGSQAESAQIRLNS